MPKFRKKPVVIEALKWLGFNVRELAEWAAFADLDSRKARGDMPPGRNVNLPLSMVAVGDGTFHLDIDTPEGVMRATPGDWIICGVKGEFYPCKPEIFEATYEEDAAHRPTLYMRPANEPNVNVTIQRVEVQSDDPDRFATGLVEAFSGPRFIDIVFDGPPGPEVEVESGRFVEVEDETGKSISVGEWVRRDDGFYALRIARPHALTREQAVEIARRCAKAKPQSYYAEPFEPHEWVVDAIIEAARGER